MDKWSRFFKKSNNREQKQPRIEESKTEIQEQPVITTVVPQPLASRDPATKQGMLRADPTPASNSKAVQKQIRQKQENSRIAGRRENTRIPASSVRPIADERTIR